MPLCLAGGGWDVTTRREEGWRCPRDRRSESVPLTPQASLVIGEHTVLLAGRTGQGGIEQALVAVDTRTPVAPLLRLPNTTHITGLAADGEDAVHLVTDIRGNDPTRRPHLLHVAIPSSGRP